MCSGCCNIVVTKSDYADRKAHYKSGFSESWAVRLLVTIGMPRLSYSVGAKIIFADGAFLRRRFAWAMRRRAVPRKRYRSEEHTSELQSLMRTSYAVFCLKKKKKTKN